MLGRMTSGVAVVALLIGAGAITALALTPAEACAEISAVASELAARRGAEPRAQAQRLMAAHAALCETPVSTTTTTLPSTTTTAPTPTTSEPPTTTSTTVPEETTSTTLPDETTTTSVPEETTTTTLPDETTTTSSTTTTTLAQPSEEFTCTRLLGLSQTRDTFKGLMPLVDADRWEGQFKGGAVLKLWADPTFDGWTNPVWSPCGQPDRVVFQAVPMRSNDIRSELRDVIGIIGERYPSVDQVDVIMVVGAESHVVCSGDGSVVSAQHVEDIAAGWLPDVSAEFAHVSMGPDLDIPCELFIDDRHFGEAGMEDVGHQMVGWYG